MWTITTIMARILNKVLLYIRTPTQISAAQQSSRTIFKQTVIQIATSSLDSIFNVWWEQKSPYWGSCSTYRTIFSLRLRTLGSMYLQTCFRHTTEATNWVVDVIQWSTEVPHGLPWQDSQLKQTVTASFIISAYLMCFSVTGLPWLLPITMTFC